MDVAPRQRTKRSPATQRQLRRLEVESHPLRAFPCVILIRFSATCVLSELGAGIRAVPRDWRVSYWRERHVGFNVLIVE